YDDSKESKKSRRQLCSNLFEHLFTQSTTEPTISSEQSSPTITLPIITSNSTETGKPAQTIPPVVPKAQPPAPPKLEFVTIESFEKENQERPPLDLFSAIFDNQNSDEDDDDEQEAQEKKSNDIIPKPINPSIPKQSASSKTIHMLDSGTSDSSDSSIEEIEVTGESSAIYGPAIPSALPSRSKTERDSSIWTKLANTNEQYEELKLKKKHKKKKNHHKKSKKHHH
ncbi:unnamed protein product, partial [Rotaria magnacalcarata]